MPALIRSIVVLACVLLLATSLGAQTSGKMVGEVRDQEGKLAPGQTIVLKSEERGTTYSLTTDSKGQFVQGGLHPGMYTVSLKNVNGQVIYELKAQVTASGKDPLVEINLKEINLKEAEARKKQLEEQSKFENMKEHFDAARAAMDQAKGVRDQIQHTPADQRGPLEEKLAGLQKTAIGEYEAAEKSAPEKDPNLHMVLANLAQAYELSGRYEEAAANYEKAIALKPNQVSYYQLRGTALARAGKVAEAGAACDKAVGMDKATGATCWRNVGIVLYNSNRLKEAVEPFRRATQLEPNHADTWYFLGASLLAAMDYKQEGDKMVAVVQPGIVEAYQKYLELAPNGRFAGDAQASLSALASLGAGIETKVKTRKK